MNNLNREELLIELAEVKLEIKNAEKPALNPTSAEDIDDAYQECLEYGWWMNEMNGRIDEINECLNKLDDD